MTDEEKRFSAERLIQLLIGGAIWFSLMWSDHQSGIGFADLLELSTSGMALHLSKYAVAFILMKGITVKEIAELLRAWKGK